VASGGYSFVYQSIAVTAAVYTWSVWLRGNVGGERVYISATQNTSAYYELSCTLTTAWQRFSLKTPALSALVWLFQVGSDQRDPAQGVQSAATIFAWGAQVELGSSATFYIPTTTVANGAPRWDYDPVTHVLNGLRIEEARTNSVLNSATLVTQNVTVTAVPWTLSFYGTGTVTLSGVSTAGPLTGTGAANRVALAFTPTAGTLTLTVTGSVTSAQLEVGTFATSYIPTAGAAATRAIEICTMPTAAWFNTAVGSAVTDLMLPQVLSTGSNIEMLGLDQGATTDIIAARQSGASIIFSTNSFVAGVGKGGPGVAAPVLVAGLVSRAGFTYNVSSAVITVALNGSTVTSSTTTGLPTAISRCTFGTGRNTPLNGYLRRVRYWPRALTNAELQSVTT
jgi:hypothetical protein